MRPAYLTALSAATLLLIPALAKLRIKARPPAALQAAAYLSRAGRERSTPMRKRRERR
jgi:hypothetical protein